MRAQWAAAAAVSFVTMFTCAAHAADCKPLARVASFDIEKTDGAVVVAAGIEGTPTKMIVDTGSPATTIDPLTAQSLNLKPQRMVEGSFVTSSGKDFVSVATVHELTIGNTRASMVRMLVYPGSLPAGIGGILGDDFLGQYDVELDFAAHKLNLFLPEHCPGAVYWPAPAIAAVPLRMNRLGQPIVSVTLDGQTFDAMLDTGSSTTTLSDLAAGRIFQISRPANSTGVFEHRFNSLVLDGINMANIPVAIVHDGGKEKLLSRPETGTRLAEATTYDNGVVDLVLGMHELQKLHLFLSHHDGRMYATPPAPATN